MDGRLNKMLADFALKLGMMKTMQQSGDLEGARGWPQLAELYVGVLALPRRITLYVHTASASEGC